MKIFNGYFSQDGNSTVSVEHPSDYKSIKHFTHIKAQRTQNEVLSK